MLLSQGQMVKACLAISAAGLLFLFFLSLQQNYVSLDEAAGLPAGSNVVTSGIVKSVSAGGSFSYIEVCQNACVRAVADSDEARAALGLLSPDDIVQVEGRVGAYGGKVEINAKSIRRAG